MLNKAIYNQCKRIELNKTKIDVRCIFSIVKVRETHLTVLLSHIFIGMSLFMRDILKTNPDASIRWFISLFGLDIIGW